MYQNQFQKYDPQPFVEADIEPMVVSDDGPIMSQWACRAALQRSVSKIFYHAGFEETQPSALEAVTDIASGFFNTIARTLASYQQVPKVKIEQDVAKLSNEHSQWRPRFTREEIILHTLHENGVDLEALEGYAKDDVERLGAKLEQMHDRMKSHLAELLVSYSGLSGSEYAITDNAPCSVRHLIPPKQVLMARESSTMIVNSSSVAILQKILAKTSSGSRSWASIKNSVSQRSVFRYIFCRIGCTTPTRHRMQSK
jgi:hypothetical protein